MLRKTTLAHGLEGGHPDADLLLSKKESVMNKEEERSATLAWEGTKWIVARDYFPPRDLPRIENFKSESKAERAAVGIGMSYVVKVEILHEDGVLRDRWQVHSGGIDADTHQRTIQVSGVRGRCDDGGDFTAIELDHASHRIESQNVDERFDHQRIKLGPRPLQELAHNRLRKLCPALELPGGRAVVVEICHRNDASKEVLGLRSD